MSNILKPWAKSVFELLLHAEIHLNNGEDFDRRMAHIGFDNAIEVAIATYLALNPIQRNGKTYEKDDVTRWLRNYHSGLDFLEKEAKERERQLKVPKDEIIYYHDIRNHQYHTGGPSVPQAAHLAALRKATLDTFAMLFDVDDIERVLEQYMTEQKEAQINRDKTLDKLLDMADEPVLIAGQPYMVSEALLATDPNAYEALAITIEESRDIFDELSAKYPGSMLPTITGVSFVHYEGLVYLKIKKDTEDLALTETGFIEDGQSDQFFSLLNLPNQNADRLVNDFDPYSIINCFDLFTSEATVEIARKFEASQDGGEVTE